MILLLSLQLAVKPTLQNISKHLQKIHCVLLFHYSGVHINSGLQKYHYVIHHGMARPQVADRGTASDMEGSCE